MRKFGKSIRFCNRLNPKSENRRFVGSLTIFARKWGLTPVCSTRRKSGNCGNGLRRVFGSRGRLTAMTTFLPARYLRCPARAEDKATGSEVSTSGQRFLGTCEKRIRGVQRRRTVPKIGHHSLT